MRHRQGHCFARQHQTSQDWNSSKNEMLQGFQLPLDCHIPSVRHTQAARSLLARTLQLRVPTSNANPPADIAQHTAANFRARVASTQRMAHLSICKTSWAASCRKVHAGESCYVPGIRTNGVTTKFSAAPVLMQLSAGWSTASSKSGVHPDTATAHSRKGTNCPN